MLEVLLLSLFFALGMSGWGHLFYKFLFSQRSTFPNSIFLGLIFTSQFALSFHFFTALSPLVTEGIVSIGFISFFWQFFKIPIRHVPVSTYLLGGISFILIAGFALDSNIYSDVVAYHFPTLAWIKNFKIVFGLANLNDRLGFNSIWHLASSLSNPFLRWQSSMDYASIVFLWVYFINVFYLPSKLRLLGWISRAVAFLIWGKATFLINLGLPATDLPSTICCLVFYEKVLMIYDQENMDEKDFIEVSLIYLFAFQLKLSQVFLIFPFSVLIFSFRRNILSWIYGKRWKMLALVVLFIFPWILRSFVLSGCWLFPVVQSCFPQVSWGLPLVEVSLTKFYVLAWARVQDSSLDSNNFREWFPAWAHMQFMKGHIQLFVLSSLTAGFLGINKIRKNKFKVPDEAVVAIPISFYISISFVFILWFLQGPDPRFTMGTFIFWQALILWFICNQLSFLIKFKVYLKAGLFIILCVYLQDLMRICCNGFRKAPIWSDRFTDADRLTYLDKVSQFQVAYKVPDLKKYPEGGCWLVESLCANQDRPFLMQSNLGSYLVFRTGKNPKNE